VRQYADHPALLAVAIGNELPVPIVRWHGAAAIERHLRRLYDAAKDADPGALVTYVNYPTTEYLELPFLDLVCFNVYPGDPVRERLALESAHAIRGARTSRPRGPAMPRSRRGTLRGADCLGTFGSLLSNLAIS
jgi:hypothetical protein